MKVLVVEPYYAPYEKEINGLHEMQAVVGGLIQPIYPYQEQEAVVCNEEGLINGLPLTECRGGYGVVFGHFLCAGCLKETSVLDSQQMERFIRVFMNANPDRRNRKHLPHPSFVPPEKRGNPSKEKGRDLLQPDKV